MVVSAKLNKSSGSRFAPFKPRAAPRKQQGPPKAAPPPDEGVDQNSSSSFGEESGSNSFPFEPRAAPSEQTGPSRAAAHPDDGVDRTCDSSLGEESGFKSSLFEPRAAPSEQTDKAATHPDEGVDRTCSSLGKEASVPTQAPPSPAPSVVSTPIPVPAPLPPPPKATAIPIPGSSLRATGGLAAAAGVPEASQSSSGDEGEDNTVAEGNRSKKRRTGNGTQRRGGGPKLLDNFEDYDAQPGRDISEKSLKDFCKVSYAHGKPMKAWFEKQKALVAESKQKRAEEKQRRAVDRLAVLEKRDALSASVEPGQSSTGTDEAREEENAEAREEENAELRTEDTHTPPVAPPKLNHAAPQLRMVNGVWIFDTDTLRVSHRAIHDEQPEPMEVTEESASTQMVNSLTHMRKVRCAKWTAEDTDLLYEGLSRFGTDFTMITGLFCGTKERTNVKNKFKREQKVNADRINQALRNKKGIDIEQYSQLTHMAYPPPKTAEELEEERLREIERRKQRAAQVKAIEEKRAEAAAAAAAAAAGGQSGGLHGSSNGRKGKNKRLIVHDPAEEIVGVAQNLPASMLKFSDWGD